MIDNPYTYGGYQVDGSLNLNQYFAGFNMWYNITSINNRTNQLEKLSSQFIIEEIIQ